MANPAAHSHQLEALKRELELIVLAPDADSYRSWSGDLFELVRAAWLDRLSNQAQLAATLDNWWSAGAAAMQYQETVQASSNEDWVRRLTAQPSETATLQDRSAEASANFVRLILCTLLSRSGDRTPEVSAEAVGSYRSLREADPEFNSESLTARPFYRRRVPWTGEGLSAVCLWIDQLPVGNLAPTAVNDRADPLALIAAGRAAWREDLKRRSNVVPSSGEPSVEDVIAPYRDLADLRFLQAGSPQEALEWITRKRLPASLAAAPLRAQAENGLARQSAWPDPLMEHHWRALLQELDQARTVTEVEFAVAREEACFAVEACWNVVFLTSLLGPVREACRFGWASTDAARRGAHDAANTSYALSGLGPRALLDVPRVSAFLTHCLARFAGQPPPELGAFWGEAGFDALEQARGWVAIQRVYGDEVLRNVRASLVALYDRARLPEPAAASRPVQLWGEGFTMDGLGAALARPPRPIVKLSVQGINLNSPPQKV